MSETGSHHSPHTHTHTYGRTENSSEIPIAWTSTPNIFSTWGIKTDKSGDPKSQVSTTEELLCISVLMFIMRCDDLFTD